MFKKPKIKRTTLSKAFGNPTKMPGGPKGPQPKPAATANPPFGRIKKERGMPY